MMMQWVSQCDAADRFSCRAGISLIACVFHVTPSVFACIAETLVGERHYFFDHPHREGLNRLQQPSPKVWENGYARLARTGKLVARLFLQKNNCSVPFR